MHERADNAEIIRTLQMLLDAHNHERVMVLGTSCTGKSTFVSQLHDVQDMDALVFPTLSEAETAYVTQTPWTPDIGDTMTRLVRERVIIIPGVPVVGTVLIDADVVVHLRISDELLRTRAEMRGVPFSDVKQMQQYIEAGIAASNIPVIAFPVG